MPSPFDQQRINRRQLLASGAGAISAILGGLPLQRPLLAKESQAPYTGPNIILIRFGGGVRRQETLDPLSTYAPFFRHTLVPRGTLYPLMEIDHLEGVDTSHGEGTLHLLTGKYKGFVPSQQQNGQFEPIVPTLFEYLRKQFQIQDHEALLINGENRTSEEFYSFSNHHLFGISYSSQVLSLYRFKVYLLRKQLAAGLGSETERHQQQRQLEKLERLNPQSTNPDLYPEAISQFWDRWQSFYGSSGLVNPRGDRLLTELAIWALKYLRPKFMMINFQDPDYVHWGYASHYLNGIAIIDQGLERLVTAVAADPEYAEQTVFCIVPDCGRDANPFLSVPFQHHFNSRSAHEIFALLVGPGIRANQIIDRKVSQIDITPTLGQLMHCSTDLAEGRTLEDIFV